MVIDKNTNICISIAAEPGNFGAIFHNSAYRELNLNWIYLPRKLTKTSYLIHLINNLRLLEIIGCSVSMPHKEKIIDYLDSLDQSAERIGAVNTILNSKGSLKGYNTDYFGAKKALKKISIKNKEVLLVGAGGVAKAIGFAVKDLGGKLTICNRNNDRGEDLCELLNSNFLTHSKLNSANGHLLINATSVGMNAPEEMIVNDRTIDNFDVVMDAVIYPAKTKILSVAQDKGKVIVPGTLMCVYQALEQFKIYTGLDVPKKILDRTIRAFK